MRTNMGIRAIQAAILEELRTVANNRSIKQRDIMEWSTGTITPQEGETLYVLPDLRMNVAVKLPAGPAKKEAQP